MLQSGAAQYRVVRAEVAAAAALTRATIAAKPATSHVTVAPRKCRADAAEEGRAGAGGAAAATLVAAVAAAAGMEDVAAATALRRVAIRARRDASVRVRATHQSACCVVAAWSLIVWGFCLLVFGVIARFSFAFSAAPVLALSAAPQSAAS
jgi:hypothetical protein